MDLYILDVPYIDRVRKAGGLPVLVPHVMPEDADDMISRLDGLIVSGGDDIDPASYGAEDEGVTLQPNPEADRCEMSLVQAAAKARKPVLGICRGSQIVNIAFGGSLHQHMLADEVKDVHGKRPEILSEILAVRHEVEIAPDSILADALGTSPRRINSTHHQAVKDVAEGFKAVAWAPDGIVEAIQSNIHNNILAVQWHPEKLPAPDNQELFEWIVKVAG